jgi:hypothetical protein
MFDNIKTLAQGGDYGISIYMLEAEGKEGKKEYQESCQHLAAVSEVVELQPMGQNEPSDEAQQFLYPLLKDQKVPEAFLHVEGINVLEEVNRSSDVLFCFLCRRKPTGL